MQIILTEQEYHALKQAGEAERAKAQEAFKRQTQDLKLSFVKKVQKLAEDHRLDKHTWESGPFVKFLDDFQKVWNETCGEFKWPE